MAASFLGLAESLKIFRSEEVHIVRLDIDSYAKERFDECVKAIEESNKHKSSQAPAALIIQSSFGQEAFSNCKAITKLARTHFIIFKCVQDKKEFFEAIRQSSSVLSESMKINTLIIRAHGNKEGDALFLGEKTLLKGADFTADCFDSLDSRATILFDVCFAGRQLAPRINEVAQGRLIEAYSAPTINGGSYYPYCATHGVEIFDALNESQQEDQVKYYSQPQHKCTCQTEEERHRFFTLFLEGN